MGGELVTMKELARRKQIAREEGEERRDSAQRLIKYVPARSQVADLYVRTNSALLSSVKTDSHSV